MELEPNNVEFRHVHMKLKKDVDELNEKRKNELFGNLKELGNNILGLLDD